MSIMTLWLLLAPALVPAQAAPPQAPAPAAQPARPPAPQTYEEYIFVVWRGLHNKILAMAKDFPEDKFDWKPHPDSRSMIAEFRHVVIGLEMSAAELRGDTFDYGGRMKALEALPAGRAAIVEVMERAIEASYPLVQKSPKPRLVWWVDHQAEHYGKLVSNYRINGLVPPASRPRTAAGQ